MQINPMDFEASELFGVIGEEHRLQVLSCLLERPRSVQEIGVKIKIEKTLLSKHLKALRSVGLVYSTRSGRNLIYHVNPKVQSRTHKRSIQLHCCEIRLKKV
ncbi:MAG: metalloregulator ArsR/SmtB family transcription factor [Bdellovibrionota bacterium]